MDHDQILYLWNCQTELSTNANTLFHINVRRREHTSHEISPFLVQTRWSQILYLWNFDFEILVVVVLAVDTGAVPRLWTRIYTNFVVKSFLDLEDFRENVMYMGEKIDCDILRRTQTRRWRYVYYRPRRYGIYRSPCASIQTGDIRAIHFVSLWKRGRRKRSVV